MDRQRTLDFLYEDAIHVSVNVYTKDYYYVLFVSKMSSFFENVLFLKIVYLLKELLEFRRTFEQILNIINIF